MGSVNIDHEEHDYDQKNEVLLGEVKCHKIVLGLFSAVFKGEFFGPAKETKDVIPVRQTTLKSFEFMVDFMYNKIIDWGNLSVEEMYDVVNLAEKYHIPALTEVVESKMNDLLTMNNVLQVAEISEQFTQFPAVSSSLLAICAKFLRSKLTTNEQLLKFARNQSGNGQEATVLKLLFLIGDLPTLPACSNCGEMECQDGKLIWRLDGKIAGLKVAVSTQDETNSWFGKTATLLSFNMASNLVSLNSPFNLVEEHELILDGNNPQFCCKCH